MRELELSEDLKVRKNRFGNLNSGIWRKQEDNKKQWRTVFSIAIEMKIKLVILQSDYC